MIKPIVIKYGGSLLEEPGHRSRFLQDVVALFNKKKLILVHGGGKEISRQMEQAGITPRFVNGRRFTDEATMRVVQKALASLNQEIVSELARYGQPAQGGSGQEGHLLIAQPVKDLGRVGTPSQVNPAALERLLSMDTLPVLYSVAEDAHAEPLNMNADDFALALAVASRAERLVFLTDTGGVLDAKGQKVDRLRPDEVELLAKANIITGGMLVKARACVDALQAGVGSVDIVKGIDYLLQAEHGQPSGTIFSSKER